MNSRQVFIRVFFFAFIVLAFVPKAQASDGDNIALVAQGAFKTIGSVMQIPINMVQDSARVMFPFGILTGSIRGTAQAVAGTVSGAMDMARGAAPYAKYLVFL